MGSGFIEFLQFMVYYKEFFVTPSSPWPNIIGAASGAFCAFFLTVLYHWLAQRSDKWDRHLSALNQIDIHLNSSYTLIVENTRLIDSIIQTYSTSPNKTIGTSALPTSFSLVELTVVEKIRNTGATDYIIKYNLIARSINENIKLASDSYYEARRAFIDRKIDFSVYSSLHSSLIDFLKTLRNKHDEMQFHTLQLHSVIRYRLRKDNPKPLILLLKRPKMKTPTKEEIELEKALINIELTKNKTHIWVKN